MIFQYICPPASLYLAFSIIQILIDMFRGEMTTAFLKFLVMIIFTVALNVLCASGLGIISWFIVFIPFILMTYITTILFFVFGIPNESNLRPERKKRRDHEHKRIGGCAGTRFGCCHDGVTAKRNYHGSNCPPHPHHHKHLVGGCAGTQYGCCDDGVTAKSDENGSNCQYIGGCGGTQYGCCDDGVTAKSDENGSNCQNIGGCAGTQYGCCNDGVTPNPCPSGTSLVLDPKSSLAPEKLVGGCAGTQYGCCSDGSAALGKACGVFNPVT